MKTTESEKSTMANQAAVKPAENRQRTKAVSHPREVAAVVMAQMNLVNAKKDELTIAIKGLTDITQQLTQAYAGQVQVIAQLTNRLKALEGKAGVHGENGLVAQDKRVA
jgi:hypothetical protein